MARGVRLTDQQRQAIIDALPSGDSCNAIARRHRVSPDTVSKIARSVGHRWGVLNVAAAHEATKAYGAEHRAFLRRQFQRRAEQLLDDTSFDGSYLVGTFGGRDNVWNEERLNEPPIEARRQMIQAAATAVKEARALDEHDRSDEHLSDFDEWLRVMSGGDEAAS